MGVFSFLKKKFRSYPPSHDYWFQGVAKNTTAGVPVSEETAFKYLVLASCVSLISGDIAKLPIKLFQKNGDGKKKVLTDHPLSRLVQTAPNSEMNGYTWRESAQSHLLMWGNTYHEKEYDGQGNVIGLWPLDPAQVKMDRIGGKLVYVWQDPIRNVEVVKSTDDVLHIPGMGFNGIKGMSMIQVAREAIGLGLAEEEYQARFVGSGTHPAGVLEMDGYLGETGEKAFKKSFADQYQGLGRSHSVMVLEGGLKYKPLAMSMEDAQFLESRTFQKLEICGYYRVPPHKVAIHGSNSNYNNLEQENQSYVDSNLSHWVSRWESSLNDQLLSEAEQKRGLYFKFMMQALLRGDMAARAEFFKTFWGMGLDLNTILALEDMDAVEGGDVGLVPMNMTPLKTVMEVAEKELEPDPVPVIAAPEEVPVVEEPEPEKKSVISDQELIEYRETRGIMMRDRIVRRYHPLFLQAAQAIVNKEGLWIKSKVGKRTSFDKMLTKFYRDQMATYIRQKMGPTMLSYGLTIQDESYKEVGGDTLVDPNWINDYIARYTERHVESSVEQVRSLYGEDQEEKIEQRVDEWSEKRAEKIANNETTRLANGMFQAVAFAAGMTTVWRIRGKDTCPYCREFDGRRVASGGSFADSGDEVGPKGQPPMKIYGMKAHPPLHQGCDCYIGV